MSSLLKFHLMTPEAMANVAPKKESKSSIKKTGKVVKAPNVVKVTKVNGTCCFFDAIAAIVTTVGVDASVGAGIAALGTSAGALGVAGPLIGGALAGGALGAIGGGIAGDPLKGFEIGAGLGAGIGGSGIFEGAAAAGDAGVGGAAGLAGGAPGAAAGSAAVASPVVGGASAAGLAGGAADAGSLAAAADPLATVGAGSGLGTAGADVSAAAGSLGPGTAGISADLGAGQAAALPGAISAPSASSLGAGLQGIAAGTPTATSAGGLFGTGISTSEVGTGISALGLGKSLLAGQQQPTALKNLNNVANAEAGQSQQLQNYLTTGTLPPGVQQSISLAEKNAEASIRSKYAGFGQSGSSAEAQDIANAKLEAANKGQQIALQLLEQGVSEANLSGRLFAEIMNQSNLQDQQVGQALQNFGAAVGGFGTGGGFKIVPAGV